MRVRDIHPLRRPNDSNPNGPTENEEGNKWSKHKPDLKIDFHSHCGYCGSYDGFRHTYFEVDHFIPKSLFEIKGEIKYCQYDNLVYSCKFCNNKKLAKWPSQDEKIPIIDNKGFVDPCDLAYESHFKRTQNGSILGITDLGKWMVSIAFKFDERDYSIKLLWNLNEIRKTINNLIDLLEEEENDSEEYNLMKSEAEKYSFDYYQYHKQLIEYYNG